MAVAAAHPTMTEPTEAETTANGKSTAAPATSSTTQGNPSTVVPSATAENVPGASSNNNPPADSDATAEFQGDVDVTNDLPTKADLAKVADLVVLAADGSSRPFKSLYSGEGVVGRVLVIFIRHFFCGVRIPPLTHAAYDFS